MADELSKKAEYEAKKQAKLREQGRSQRTRNLKGVAQLVSGIALAIGAVALLGWWIISSGLAEFSVAGSCINHSPTLAVHIHADLKITVNGENQEIPSGVGNNALCMHPVHTHDASGKLHFESPKRYAFKLGDFFAVWEKPFSRNQIFEHAADDTHEIVMTVNGEASDEYENLVIDDGQRIEIMFRAK